MSTPRMQASPSPDKRDEICAAARRAHAAMSSEAKAAFSARVISALKRAGEESEQFRKSLRVDASVFQQAITR